jgi:glycosyltransferase involved in cell wall biosynthesis
MDTPSPCVALEPEELTARWEDDRPRVSILCATFNHVDYVKDALSGFLGQITNFPFEVLIRDDASTDGTQDIIADFARRYPSIIRPVYERCNTFPRVRSNNVLIPLVRGDYIAYCEGDDYWCHPKKLQLQLAALAGAPHRSYAVHRRVVVTDGLVVRGPEYGGEQCVLHPADFQHDHRYYARVFSYDVFMDEALRRWGDCHRVDLVGAVYRLHGHGIASSLKVGGHAPELFAHRATTYFWLGVYFDETEDRRAARSAYAESIQRMLAAPRAAAPSVLALVAGRLVMGWSRRRFKAIRKSIRRRRAWLLVRLRRR